MNLFQWMTLSALGLVLTWEVVARRRRAVAPGFWLVRCLVWMAMALAIADPLLIQRVAQVLGIGRGADVVFYLFVLAFVGASFYIYARLVQLQRQITELVRHIAIQEVRRGEDRPQP